ncbi:MAG: hypothetical protein RIA09_10190 [Hoeflea sp.]|uniref:hypothetical protein n=1 Tax=Hoeflea sp. TaxID=1940281 RepID=UPI0032EC982D
MGSAKASGQVLEAGASDPKPTFAPQEKYGSFERKVVLERLIWYLGYSPQEGFSCSQRASRSFVIPIMAKLETIVAEFRARLEKNRCDDGLSLQNFPSGACGDASILLAHHLAENGFGTYRYICGRHGDASHVWLSDGEVIIDITADQFDDFNHPVFIAAASPWHDALKGEDQHEATLSVWGSNWEARYLATYEALVGGSDNEVGQ